MASERFLALELVAAAVLMAGGAAWLGYRRKVRRQQRQDSWRELCLRLELAPQPGAARVAKGELPETDFFLHDTGSGWLVELPLAQPLLPPGMLLLSANAPSLPTRPGARPLEWASVSMTSGLRAWSEAGQELSGKVEAPQAFLDEATRALETHAPLRVEPRRLIQALRVGALLSVSEARQTVRALDATARRWLEVAERHGLPRIQPLPPPPAAEPAPPPESPPPPEPPSPPARQERPPPRPQRVWRDCPHELVVDFNALPRITRERLVEATGPKAQESPLLAEASFRGSRLWTWVVVGLGVLSLFILDMLVRGDFSTGVNQDPGFILAYAATLFCFTSAALILLFQGKWRRTLPFTPGRYVFPFDFVDATSRQLRIIPLSALANTELRNHFTHRHHSQPRYAGSVITLSFLERRHAEKFEFDDLKLAQANSRNLDAQRQALVSGAGPKRSKALRNSDLFFEARHQPGGLDALQDEASAQAPSEGPLVQELPVRSRPSSLILFAALASTVLGPLLWLVRNHYRDEAAFEAALQDSSGRALASYVDGEGRRAAEARALGEQRTFQSCENTDTEECWTEFLNRWPLSERLTEIQRERMLRASLRAAPHTIAGLNKFLARYPGSVLEAEVREQLLPAAELQELPAHSATGLRRFRWLYPHSPVKAQAEARLQELFAAARAELQDQGAAQNSEPVLFITQLLAWLESSESALVSVGFRRQADAGLSGPPAAVSTEQLEEQTVKALGGAFRQLFADGILTLVHGGVLPEQPEATEVTSPRIDILYLLSKSEVASAQGSGGRRLVGLQFDFDVALRMPGKPPVHIRLRVPPPKALPLSGSGAVPSDSALYSGMAQRAFEELGAKLGTAFFRTGSKAFQTLHPRAP